MSGKLWYANSYARIRERYGEDADLFCALLAATSANSSVKTNVKLAEKAYWQIKNDGNVKRESFVRHHYSSIQRVLREGLPSGQKCENFYRALTGDENAVVIDIWMLRYFGYEHIKGGPSKGLYRELSEKVRSIAAERGITPAQCQAEIWCQTRGNGESFADHFMQLRFDF